MKKISVTIEDEQYKALEELIAKTGKNMSEVVRERLALSLNSHLSSSVPSPFISPKRSEEEGSLQETQSVYQYPACPYRTILKDGNILCKELKKVPLEACITRQKRYVAMSHNCRPIGEKPKRRPSKYGEDYSKWSNPTGVFKGHEASGKW